MIPIEEKIGGLFWSTLAVTALLMILFLGLRPKGLPYENPVKLIPEKGGVAFSKNGIAYTKILLHHLPAETVKEFTIEMAVRAENVGRHNFKSLLMLHDGSDDRQLIVGQWGSSIIVMNGNDYDHSEGLPRLSVRDAFSADKMKILTITAGAMGTTIYIDGRLAAADDHWQLTVPGRGHHLQLVLGNSVTAENSWTGEIHGLAIYRKALSSDEIHGHFAGWVQTNTFTPDNLDALSLLYTFKEQIGNRVPDQSGGDNFLTIPTRPMVLDKRFLSGPWHQFRFNRSFLSDTILNVIGFIPLGFVLSGWLRQMQLFPGNYQFWAALFVCFLLSLGIEIMQAWMPTRSSSLMDLLMNIAGAWIGIWLLDRRWWGAGSRR